MEDLEVSSINRRLEVLRRLFKLAMEWGTVEKPLAKVAMLPGSKRRERVLSIEEETAYLRAASDLGADLIASHERALTGIRARLRGIEPTKPRDPFLLRDVAVVLLDCGLRPEECMRLRWDEVRDGALRITHGKTANARRVVPLPDRAMGIVEMRRAAALSAEWVFPAETKSGHVEGSTLKKPHRRACALADIEYFPMYTMRHTFLTRLAAHIDPYTLAHVAGHADFSTTRRYVHPQAATVREAMERARRAWGGYNSGHTTETAPLAEMPDQSVIN
jgi:integrase